MSETRRTPPRLTQGVKVLYSIGGFAFATKNAILSLLLLYYNQLIGLPAQWVSLALAIALVVDALWDPLVGHVSDNLRSRWGRRHPLMYGSAIPFAICLVLLFHPPRTWPDEALFAWLLTLVLATNMTISLFEVPATALTPELTANYHERTDLWSYRFVFGALSGVGASMLGYAVFLRGTPEQPMGQLNQAGYGPFAWTIALVSAAAIFTAAAGTHRWIPFLHRAEPRATTLSESLGEISQTLLNRNFAFIVASGVFTGVCQGMSGGLAIYFNTYFWELPSDRLLVLTLAGLVAMPAAAVLAAFLSRAWGKKWATAAFMLISLAASATPVLLRLLGLMPPNGSPELVAVLFCERILTPMGDGAALILIYSMLSDVIDESELRTGRRSEGLVISAGVTLQKVLGGVAVIIPGLILAAVAFPRAARPGGVPEEVLRNLALLYLPASAAMSALAILCVTLYRIDQRTHEATLRQIHGDDPLAITEDLAVRAAGSPRGIGL